MVTTIVKAQRICNYAEVNGIKMYYTIHGSGSPLMLYTGSTIYWETVACRKYKI